MIPIKTIVPDQQDYWLPRQRLLDRLHPDENPALCLVVAPAGYGKTSLLADFSHQAPFPVCWLSLDASDRNTSAFVNYFAAALQRRFPAFGDLTQRVLEANPNLRHQPAALADLIAQDLQDNIPDFFALVIDDYQWVSDSPEINDLLGELLKHQVEHFYLIVVSQTTAPGLPIVQFTAQKQVTFIGKKHLAFTDEEVRALLAKMSHVELSSEQTQALTVRHQGQISYILLSILLHDADIQRCDGSASNDILQGLNHTDLIEQVFMEQPAALRNAMLTLSTLQEMNETCCQETLGMSGAASVLRNIRPQGVFVTTIVDQEAGVTWFRFSPPVRDFLQAQLQAQDEARFRQLHQRAADWVETHEGWFAEHERWERAVAHRLAADDFCAAARTMDAGLKTMIRAWRIETLIDWYEMLPESLRAEFPRILLFTARALIIKGHADRALSLLNQAEALFGARGDTERALLATMERVHIHSSSGHPADALALAQEVLSRAADYACVASLAHGAVGSAQLDLGRPEEAVKHLRLSLDLQRGSGTTINTAMCYLDLSLALGRLGQLSEALDCLEQAIRFLRQVGPSGHLILALNNVAYERYYLAGDYGQALAYLREALEVAQVTNWPRVQAYALLSTADLYRDLGALREAQTFHAQAEDIARQLGNAALLNFILTSMAQTLLQSGDVVEALGLAAQARDQAEERGDIYQLGLSYLTLGAARLEVGSAQTALTEIERGRDLLTQSGARRDLTRAYVLLARVRQANGDLEGALDALSQALDVGIETQTFHHLVIEGQRAFDLLKQLQRRNRADRRPTNVIDRIRALPDVAREVIGGVEPTALPYTPKLRLYGFGPGHAERDGHPIPVAAWRSRMPRRLVFYLLLNTPCTLDHILQTFWPDTDRSMARSIFHVVKQRINYAVGRRLVIYAGGLYRIAWDPDCWFDVNVFESLLDGHDEGRQARLEKAVSLYQGDFLSGYDAEWCRPLRERLRMRHHNALVELGELYVDQGEFAAGFAVLSKATPIDNLYEPASRALMRLYASDGYRDAALRHYQSLEQQLQQELGISPTPETQALYQAIQDGADASQLAQLVQTWRISA